VAALTAEEEGASVVVVVAVAHTAEAEGAEAHHPEGEGLLEVARTSSVNIVESTQRSFS
jgi:hypothetical protein